MDAGKKRYVFLGASGRVGRLLRAPALSREWDAIDVLWHFRRPVDAPDTALLWQDCSDPTPLIDAADRHGGIDGMFCFVGSVGRSGKEDMEALAAEVAMVGYVIQAADLAEIPRLIIASSSAVYDVTPDVPLREGDAISPASPYGAIKARVEEAARERSDTVVLRIGNVAGADALLGNLGTKPQSQPVLDIFPDGTGPHRSYITPRGLTRVLVKLAQIEGTLPAVLNVAARQPVAMDALLDVAGIDYIARECPASPHQHITLDTGALRSLLGDDIGGDGDAREIVASWREVMP